MIIVCGLFYILAKKSMGNKKILKCTKSVNLSLADEAQELGYKMARQDRHGALTFLVEQLLFEEAKRRGIL